MKKDAEKDAGSVSKADAKAQEKSQAQVQDAIDIIKSKFGDGSIMRFGESSGLTVEVVPVGVTSIDQAIGGGFPRGRVVEIYGGESSGKTTLANHVIAQVQREGGTAAFVDAEHALDPEYAKRLGVKINDLLISQPDNGEQALEIVETLVRSNAVDVVVVDSVAALTPKAELEGEMGDSHMALQARLMSQALRKLTSIISKTKTIVIFINQTRMKIGVFFGNPETTTGGNALKFYSSLRIELRRAAQIKKGDETVGNRVKMKIVKNKIAPPFRQTEFDIIYAEAGISISGDLVDQGLAHEIITKTGHTHNFGEVKLGVGRENAKLFLRQNPKVMKDLGAAVTKAITAAEKAKMNAE